MKAGAGIAALAVLVLLAGIPQLARPGYSPDEEFTVFAARGIAAHGLPILPSGLTYDRGAAYSFVAWLAAAASGVELPAFRAVSLASSIATLALVFALVRRASSSGTALLAAALVATSTPFWAAATTGRFYAPFLASYLACVLLLTRPRGTEETAAPTAGRDFVPGLVLLTACVSRGLHELAFTLIAIPAAALLFAAKGERRRWWRAGLAVGAGLAVAQAGLFALHYLAPFSGESMIRRFFLWQILNLFEAPPAGQYGIPLAAMVIAWVAAPRVARLASVAGLSGVSMIVAFSIARASNAAPVSAELVGAVLAEGSRYPLDMFWHIARETPVTLVVVMGGLVARLAGLGGGWRPAERMLHALWIGWVLWFGVIESGITINYLLVPVSLMLAAAAVDVRAVLQHAIPAGAGAAIPLRAAVLALVVAAVAADQWRGAGSIGDRLAVARPTIAAAGLDDVRDALQPGDRVACTDELACLLLVGRVDRWLALDDFVRERFLVRLGGGALAGVYAGSPAVFRPGDLFAPDPDGTTPGRTIIVDVFKQYPIGNSREWLPRAIDQDGLDVRPLLETPQLRVLQVSPPIGYASR